MPVGYRHAEESIRALGPILAVRHRPAIALGRVVNQDPITHPLIRGRQAIQLFTQADPERRRIVFCEHRIKYGMAQDQLVLHLIRSEEHTSELQSLMRISYAVFCLKKK